MVLALLVCVAAPARAASLVDPVLRFRTLRTEHFAIHFHGGEDALAARLARIAERSWRTLDGRLGARPPALTHVLLLDQTELASGWATPLPFNTIMLTAAAPAGSEFIGRTDDWLELVFVHEFTHIVHLDRSEGWARHLHAVFGRIPLAFPNLFLPTWHIEGLATFEESAIAGEGRQHAGDFREIEREAARTGALEPLDRVNGGLTDWPGGLAAYAYGLGFHEYLVKAFGVDRLAMLADATSEGFPFDGAHAFKKVFGTSLAELWRGYADGLAQSVSHPEGGADAATRLTHRGFTLTGARFLPPSCDTCPQEIAYSLRSPDAFPALRAIGLDGTHDRRLTMRYQGSTAGANRDVILFDQQDWRRNVGLYSDLYLFERSTRRVRRLTFEARLLDPDLSPDGRTIVCVREGSGRRDLVVLNLPDGHSQIGPADLTVLASETETRFNTPRWSPDGRWIAAERHRLGHLSELVVIDAGDGSLRVVSSREHARVVTPAWLPDGTGIVAASDVDEGPFNLFEFGVNGEAPRQLTHRAGGALWPDVSPDGRTLIFAGYTNAGFDLFRQPYPASPEAIATEPPVPVDGTRVDTASEGAPRIARYSPLDTLKPTAWYPVWLVDGDQSRLGLATGGRDVLGYHSYAVSATWLVNGPDHAIDPRRATPDWQLFYAYDRWRAALFVSASVDTSFFAGPVTDAGSPSAGTVRQQEVEVGVHVPFHQARSTHRALLSLLASTDRYALATGRVAINRDALRAGWSSSTAHRYGYSVSLERGVSAGGTVEAVRPELGADGTATIATADLRAYVPGAAPHHVIALRSGFGVSQGDPGLRRSFHVGGGTSNGEVLDFGRDAFSLLRGFAPNTFAGSHVALFNVDYRFPIARPQRGISTWPVFLHTVHASLFADAAEVWSRRVRLADAKASVGAEVSGALVLGYAIPVTVTLGVGWGHDGAHTVGDRATAYLRVGHAF